MEKLGASVSEKQARLGHKSLATTGHYLASLRRAENRKADELAALYGIDEHMVSYVRDVKGEVNTVNFGINPIFHTFGEALLADA